MMIYFIKIGDTYFRVQSDIVISWSQVDQRFLCSESEVDLEAIDVMIKRVEELPFENPGNNADFKELYSERGLSVYLDAEGNEVRQYQSFFYEGTPIYAQSKVVGHKVTIWIKGEDKFFNHPSFHIWNMIHLEHFLLERNAFVLHCCYMMYQEQAILFTAPSGTGKTTQGKLWEREMESVIINGDRGLIQKKKDGSYCVCGHPYHGSADECENKSYPIKSIVVVRRDTKDHVEELSLMKKIGLMYSESTINSWDAWSVEQLMNLLQDLCSHVTVCELHCTMNVTAVQALKEYLYG